MNVMVVSPPDVGWAKATSVRLDEAGWIDVDTLVTALARHGRPVRAAPGHSIPVDLRLSPVPPPDVLYHNTVARFQPGRRLTTIAAP